MPRRRSPATPCSCRMGFGFHRTARGATGPRSVYSKSVNFYRQFTDASGGDKVNLQGIVFDTNQGGRLPLEKYLAATLIERESLASGSKTIETVARDHGLNAKYLGMLWSSLSDSKPSILMDGLRQRWRDAKAEDAAAIAAEVAQLAEGTLEVRDRRAHRESWRADAVAGTSQSAGCSTRSAIQDSREQPRASM